MQWGGVWAAYNDKRRYGIDAKVIKITANCIEITALQWSNFQIYESRKGLGVGDQDNT